MDDRHRREPRREGGLSTADLATATEERAKRPDPELVQERRSPDLPVERRPAGEAGRPEPPRIRVEPEERIERHERLEQREPVPGGRPMAREGAREMERPVALLADRDTHELRARWEAIQIAFVDSPRDAVENADGLVAELMQQLAQSFSGAKRDLEHQWSRGEDVSTEDLRQALRRYRSFFDRLLSI